MDFIFIYSVRTHVIANIACEIPGKKTCSVVLVHRVRQESIRIALIEQQSNMKKALQIIVCMLTIELTHYRNGIV